MDNSQANIQAVDNWFKSQVSLRSIPISPSQEASCSTPSKNMSKAERIKFYQDAISQIASEEDKEDKLQE